MTSHARTIHIIKTRYPKIFSYAFHDKDSISIIYNQRMRYLIGGLVKVDYDDDIFSAVRDTERGITIYTNIRRMKILEYITHNYDYISMKIDLDLL